MGGSTFERVEAAAAYLRDRGAAPRALVILGTGLGGLGERLADPVSVPYSDIPHFPRSTSPGHAGHLVVGRYGDTPAMIMEGRIHFYEGCSLDEVTLPVRVAKALGARTLLITSAVGGMNPEHRTGDIVAIEDHINFMGDTPLRGPNDERLGPRFPDMSAPYDAALIEHAAAIAKEASFRLLRGVLVAVPGPQLETPAEYRFLSGIGADVVGMSTVPEVIAAAHAGLRVCALSVITDLCVPGAIEPVNVEEIIAVANGAAPRLEQLTLGLLPHA
ncbi:MAG: purine-nucleoside phosphorylase [Planctomycetota bacterium]|jgi:purine-nucleoside phosphorylase